MSNQEVTTKTKTGAKAAIVKQVDRIPVPKMDKNIQHKNSIRRLLQGNKHGSALKKFFSAGLKKITGSHVCVVCGTRLRLNNASQISFYCSKACRRARHGGKGR